MHRNHYQLGTFRPKICILCLYLFFASFFITVFMHSSASHILLQSIQWMLFGFWDRLQSVLMFLYWSQMVKPDPFNGTLIFFWISSYYQLLLDYLIKNYLLSILSLMISTCLIFFLALKWVINQLNLASYRLKSSQLNVLSDFKSGVLINANIYFPYRQLLLLFNQLNIILLSFSWLVSQNYRIESYYFFIIFLRSSS